MSNYDYMDSGDYADRFYASHEVPACDVCEEDDAYVRVEFAGVCPECGFGLDSNIDQWDGREDAAMESALFGDC